MGGVVVEFGFVKYYVGKEGVEGKRDIKQFYGVEGDVQCQGQY